MTLALQGAYTALVTPFRDGELDLEALDRVIEQQVAGGISGVVPCGTTGESPTLSASEQRAVIARVVATTRGRTQVIAGTGTNATRETIERTELEKRVIILQCYLQHDSYRVLSEVPGDEGRRVVRVEITRGTQKRQPSLHTVQGPGGRWYVENVELAAVRDFCGLP